MMLFTEDFVFTMPLTLKHHQIANQFRQQHLHPEKAKQVYLNTLAVQAVQSYLGWFSIETDLEASDSWHPALQSLADTADLVIKGNGKLECRTVLPSEAVCPVPPEVCHDRIGYVAVQFNSELSEATLLGFVPAVTTTEIALTELRSLDELLDHLAQPEPAKDSVQLGQWLEGIVETGWQTIAALLQVQQPAWSFRSGNQSQVIEPPITRGKLLDLTPSLDSEPLALLIGLLPADDATIDPTIDVWVKLCPTGTQTHLPPELELLVLDDAGIAAMQAQSRNTEMIQLKFKAMPGEKFSIQVILGVHQITEKFVI